MPCRKTGMQQNTCANKTLQLLAKVLKQEDLSSGQEKTVSV